MPTKTQIKRSRLLAEALQSEALSTAPVGHWTQGVARLAQGLAGSYQNSRADKMEGERSQQLAQALGGGMSPSEMRNYGVVNDFEELLPMADRQEDFAYKKGRDTVEDSHWTSGHNLQQDQFGLEKKKTDWTMSQPIEVGGNLVDRNSYKPLYESPASPSTVINTGGDNDTLRKELSKKEAGTWGDMLTAATTSGGTAQDLDVLDELLKMAPQGPVQGRLAQTFQGFSSSADAANSIMKRIAPTLRAPGSGSTSDIEYDGLLKSMPNLVNTPQGNQIISQTMRAKAQINIERGEVISGYQNGTLSEVDARNKLLELNKRSIMSPEMKQAIFGQNAPTQTGGSDIDPLLDKYAPNPK